MPFCVRHNVWKSIFWSVPYRPYTLNTLAYCLPLISQHNEDDLPWSTGACLKWFVSLDTSSATSCNNLFYPCLHELQIVPVSCSMSVCPHTSVQHPVAENSWNLIVGAFVKIINKHQYWLCSDKNSEHITQRPKYNYIVDSSTKYFVAWQQCKNYIWYDMYDMMWCDIWYDMEPIVAFQWQHWTLLYCSQPPVS